MVALGGERGGWVESYNRSTMEIHLVNGAKIVLASSEDGASAVEGKNLSGAWCEELGLWSRWEVAWDRALRPALRKADARVIATGTPRFGMPAAKLIRRLLDDPSVPVSTLRTIDNAANLNAERLADLERIKHTRLGRQELEGELVEDNPDALWNPDLIEAHRRILGPGESWEDLRLTRVVIGVDPAVTSHKPGELREEVFGEDGTRKPSDQTGIVVMGLGVDGHGYVLADLTGWFRPEEMARVVIGAYQRWMADRVIVEVNNGGDYIPAILASADSTVPVRQVRASRGKVTRAEPVAAAYASGLVHHVGVFGELEEQMCNWSPALGSSPDRVDALVWAATALKLTVETVGWGDVWAPKPKPVDGFAPPNPWLEVYSN